jgi:hypothetical protein
VFTVHIFAKNNSVSLLAVSSPVCLQTACRQPAKRLVVSVERETGLEPATACLEGRNSTTELLPLNILKDRRHGNKGMVGVRGLEPRTSWSQTMRATNCATPRDASSSTRTQEQYNILIVTCQAASLLSAAIAELEQKEIPACSDAAKRVTTQRSYIPIAS